MYSAKTLLMHVLNRDGKLQFYTAECPEGDRECLKNRCITTYTCGALIMNDGWEIADDYPIKL